MERIANESNRCVAGNGGVLRQIVVLCEKERVGGETLRSRKAVWRRIVVLCEKERVGGESLRCVKRKGLTAKRCVPEHRGVGSKTLCSERERMLVTNTHRSGTADPVCDELGAKDRKRGKNALFYSKKTRCLMDKFLNAFRRSL